MPTQSSKELLSKWWIPSCPLWRRIWCIRKLKEWDLQVLIPHVNTRKESFIFGSLINPLNPSANTKKRNGARGSPWRIPFWDTNSSVGLPLTRTEIEEDCQQLHIHTNHFPVMIKDLLHPYWVKFPKHLIFYSNDLTRLVNHSSCPGIL